jgi:glycyl-tRNA synthetase beta chain
LRGYLRDGGYTAIEVEAVLCLGLSQLDQVPRQLAAVRAFAGLPEAGSLAAANKRVANILRQAEAKGESFVNAEADKLKEPAERALFDALKTASRQATPLFEQGDYTGYLKTFAVLKSPVDAFFDAVMVMVDDAALRQNRLALLADLRREMNRVADISKLAS